MLIGVVLILITSLVVFMFIASMTQMDVKRMIMIQYSDRSGTMLLPASLRPPQQTSQLQGRPPRSLVLYALLYSVLVGIP